ncbi:hypothetical protein NQ318_008483 [Aromia moschata]|uniref:Protein LTV1 homolog n=1 Tax=Aromia moschata TaxID=1265417 RepID=A0AAV8YCK1_9CUCU|nr:hypothetical protein NQ318_008483 [Aromia moschata]
MQKKGVTFQLVHRSQQDPLVADENAPQRVLLPVEDKETKKNEERLEEQHKYGIFYDDDFNYLEHLKDIKDIKMEWPGQVEKELAERQQEVTIKLPSSVFASEVEEKIGMLNKAAPVSGPQLHLDPDVVAAMDEDFDYSDPENQLEDNFIELANGIASDQGSGESEESELDSDFDDNEMDEIGSLHGSQNSFGDEETKTRFTNYSITSSVMRRNDQLTLLDERFEKMFASYEENELGALECEEIEGHIPETSDILLQYADEFKKSQKGEQIDKSRIAGNIKNQLENISEDEEEYISIPVAEKEKWDCESILSTYSNIYNHPKLISEPKGKIIIDKKTGVPKNVLFSNKLTTKTLNRLNEQNGNYNNKEDDCVSGVSLTSRLSTLSIRPKDETSEEKKERKKLLREYRKERRIEREN